MSIPELEELEELRSRVQALQERLGTVTDQEWRAYVKVRHILAFDSGFEPGGANIAGAFRCAMMGIFETPDAPRQLGEDDAGAVQRFADLGG